MVLVKLHMVTETVTTWWHCLCGLTKVTVIPTKLNNKSQSGVTCAPQVIFLYVGKCGPCSISLLGMGLLYGPTIALCRSAGQSKLPCVGHNGLWLRLGPYLRCLKLDLLIPFGTYSLLAESVPWARRGVIEVKIARWPHPAAWSPVDTSFD